MGHACGHNLIAASALGAGIALAQTADGPLGRVLVYGTPAEEGGGGKIIMARAGAFDGVDVALMVHPGTRNVVAGTSLASMRAHVEFFGRAAHAFVAPEKGISALESVIQTFIGVRALRETVRADGRIHGIITHGGDAVNIIPAYAAARFSVRSLDMAYTIELLRCLRECAEAAARSTGARLEFVEISGYADLQPNLALAAAFGRNVLALGLRAVQMQEVGRMGSTDMGDVSQMLPAIHPYMAIAPESVPPHSLGFAEAAISDVGHRAMLQAARALAMTGADLLTDPELLAQMRAEFAAQQTARSATAAG